MIIALFLCTLKNGLYFCTLETITIRMGMGDNRWICTMN